MKEPIRSACLLLSAGLTLVLGACQTQKKSAAISTTNGLVAYVNPFIGTTPLTDPKIVGFVTPADWRPWSGLTYPGSALPNAMVQLSPITAWGSGAGYQYEDSSIIGFAHTNKGHWNLCNVPILPVSGNQAITEKFSSRFSHARESASPGYYQVYLDDYGIDVQLTSTLRAGFHQYTFNNATGRKVLFDLGHANNRVRSWKIEKTGESTVQGVQDVGNDKIYFYAILNAAISSLEKDKENQRDGKALLTLKDDGNKTVELRIGLSFVSSGNAKANLEQEIGSRSFTAIRRNAEQTWDVLLSRIQVEGGTAKEKELFYTSLYRSILWPALRSDLNGQFTDAKHKVATAGHDYYELPSLWDTYRNNVVLQAMLSPKMTSDVIKSMKDIGDKTGFIPTFFHGDHGASYIAGSFLRGIDNFDVEGTYRILLKNAFVEGPSRPHLDEYMEKGFISDPDVPNPNVETKANAGVSKTLEYAYDDYALAQMAKKLGDTANYRILMGRSQNYRNVFDPSSRFMRGRLANGSWIKPFNPEYPYYEYMYREANAWQVSFYVPHDTKGLVEIYGGAAPFEAKLDSLFTYPWNPSYIARNVETMVGQYCQGNQPDHEAPFAYYFINKPEKSQKMIDYILGNLYGMGKEGLDMSGMDDAGEMSSWYVFSAAGLYPYAAVDPQYLATVPVFTSLKWTMPNGKVVTVNRTGGSRSIGTVLVNGKRVENFFVSHDVFKTGGTIEIATK